jgi:hypothetical protein
VLSFHLFCNSRKRAASRRPGHGVGGALILFSSKDVSAWSSADVLKVVIDMTSCWAPRLSLLGPGSTYKPGDASKYDMSITVDL